MKALTIRQPWASLIALGVKTIETRSWRAPQALIGQTIAIHAGNEPTEPTPPARMRAKLQASLTPEERARLASTSGMAAAS